MKIKSYFNKIIPIVITTLAGTIPVATHAVNTHIQTDGSLSGISELNINVPGIHTLSELNGKLSGQNLFYSFSNFSIGATDTAWFNLNTPGLANVISRVTGGTESLISGNLTLTNHGSTPAFYFINPSGISFGAGASVDVPGSFYVSTASGLNFSNGDQFPAITTGGSSLSSATPESFGFLGNEAGIINIGSSDTDTTNLAFKPGTNVAFAANHILIDNAVITNADTSQEGIQLQITATGNESANIKPDNFANPNLLPAGEMIIYNSHIEASGNGSGYLAIQSGNLITSYSNLFADNTGITPMLKENDGVDVFIRSNLTIDHAVISSDANPGDGGSVNVIADSIKILNGGSISSSTYSSGNSGDLDIRAREMQIDGTGIFHYTDGTEKTNRSGIFNSPKNEEANGNAGSITIEIKELLQLDNFGVIESDSSGGGVAGNVHVLSGKLTVNNNAYISSDALSTGSAGNVLVDANSIELRNGGLISSSTYGSGNAGIVLVQAGDLKIDGTGSSSFTGIASDTLLGSTGHALGVGVAANSVKLLNGGLISSSTFGSGNAGTVAVLANKVDIDGFYSYSDADGNPQFTRSGIQSDAKNANSGDAGTVYVVGLESDIEQENYTNVETLNITNGGAISTDSINSSKDELAGQITVAADSLNIIHTGLIDSSTSGSGDAGIVLVQAGQLKIDGAGSTSFTGIASDTLLGSTGHALGVGVAANSVKLLNGGLISSSTFGSGNAGTVAVLANKVDIDGFYSYSDADGNPQFTRSGIQSDAKNANSGDAGTVYVVGLESDIEQENYTNVETLNITNGGAISTDSINSSKDELAGQITVAADSLNIIHTGLIDSSTSGSGDAGIVLVQAGQLKIDGAGSTSFTGIASDTLLGSTGHAFGVGVAANSVKLLNGGLISSSTFGSGNAGTVAVLANKVDIDGFYSYSDADGNPQFTRSGIQSDAKNANSGDAGTVYVVGLESDIEQENYTNVETLNITNGGAISTDSINSSKDELAGQITVAADSLNILHTGLIDSSTSGSGNAGIVLVQAGQLKIDGAGSTSFTGIASDTFSSGNAAGVAVVANSVELLNGGLISSSSFGDGDAGVVIVQADEQIKIDGGNSNLPTGIVTNAAFSFDEKTGAYIPVSTLGRAGFVDIKTNMLDLNNGGKILSLVNNASYLDSFNRFGSYILMAADQINLTNNALISTATYGQGNAGSLGIQVNSINLENNSSVDSNAEKNSTGNAGTVLIVGKESDIPNEVFTNVDSIKLKNGSSLRTSSMGDSIDSTGGNIKVHFQEIFLDSEAKIESTAKNGQGGDISLVGDKLAYLNNSIISTSTISGNGGNISVNGVDYLVMQGGFIQSNTEGIDKAKAGQINIDDKTTIVASNETLITSTNNIEVFGTGRNGRTINVIQTAAPNGLSGNTSFSLPQLNLNAMMVNLPIEKFDPRVLNQDMCAIEEGSSLVISGKGGLRSRAGDFLH